MNKALLFFFTFLFSIPAFSQLSFTPDPAESGGYTTQVDIELHLDITNETSEPLILLWRLTTEAKPDGWDFQVCDLNLCYDANVDKCPINKPNLLLANSTAPFIFHTLPNNEEGVGNFTLQIFPEDDPGNILLDIPITSNVLFTSTVDPLIENLKLYPNPTSDYFQLSNYSKDLSNLSITNIVGKEMKSFKVQEGASYDVSNLQSGMYLVRLYDNKKSVKKVLRLSKR